jgi:hypothetical protein
MLARVDFFSVRVSTKNDSGTFAKAVLFSEKTVSDIDYDSRIRNRDIGFVDIEEDLENEDAQKHILATYRSTELTEKEINTVKMINSVLLPHKADRLLESLKIWITGKIPVRFVNIDVMEILHFNSTENVR